MLKNADPESRRIFWLACVATVSARGRRESWDKSKKKKKGMTGRGREEKETLDRKPTILKNCVRPWTQLLIGAVLVELIE